MRKIVMALLVVAGLLGGTLVARAAMAVVINGTEHNTWEPAAVTIAPGDTVTWTNIGGFHNVVIELPGGDVSNGDPAFPPWSFDYTFLEAGTYRFYCEPHEANGMVGYVTVEAPTAVTLGDVEASSSLSTLLITVGLVLLALTGLLLLRRRA